MRAAAIFLRGAVALSVAILAAGVVLRADGVLRAGIMTIVLTPLALLLIVGYRFTRERDWSFAAISIGVLFLLGVSLILAMYW